MHVKSNYKMTRNEWLKFVASHHPAKPETVKPKGTGRLMAKWSVSVPTDGLALTFRGEHKKGFQDFEVFAFTKSEARAIVKKKISRNLPVGTVTNKVS